MIYIIGGNGFLGSGFARVCAHQGLDHQVITRENYTSLVGTECDLLINANGNSKKFLSRQDPVGDFEASVLSVRRSLSDFSFNTYVFLSSCDVYPDSTSPETTDEQTLLDPAKQSTYGLHKRLAEMCVQHASPNWLIFRGGGFVGEGMKKNAIFDAMQGDSLWISKESRLQFINTETAASIVLELAKGDIQNEVFNLCATGTVRIGDVCDWISSKATVAADAPVVTCEISLEKLASATSIPSSVDEVRKFLNLR